MRPNGLLGNCGEFFLSQKFKEYPLMRFGDIASIIYEKANSKIMAKLKIRKSNGWPYLRNEEKGTNFKRKVVEEEYKITKKLFGYANYPQFDTISLDLLSGFPDFLVKNTKIFIEVKVNSSRPTSLQESVFSELTKKHQMVFIAKYKISFSDFKIEIIYNQYEKILSFKKREKSSLEEIKKAIDSNPKSHKILDI